MKHLIKNGLLRSLDLLDRGAAHLPSMGRFRPVRGTFSALEKLHRGELEGRVLHEGQPTGKCPPGSMTERSGMRQHDYQPWPVFWTTADQARLVGKNHLWRDNQDRICMEAVYHHPARSSLRDDKWHSNLILSKPMTLDGAWTSLGSKWCLGNNYFHWLLDGLTRLAVRDTLPELAGIIIPSHTPAYVKETLHLLGLDGMVACPGSNHLIAEKYYFCAPTAMTGAWNPFGYNWLRKAFSPYFKKPKSTAPVFLTRRNASRIPDNIGQIEKTFEQAGFEIIDCGSITVREQIEKTSGATAIAGIHGAAMTNLLWASPDTPVLELFSPGFMNACYEQIAFQGGLDYQLSYDDEEVAGHAIAQWIKHVRAA